MCSRPIAEGESSSQRHRFAPIPEVASQSSAPTEGETHDLEHELE